MKYKVYDKYYDKFDDEQIEVKGSFDTEQEAINFIDDFGYEDDLYYVEVEKMKKIIAENHDKKSGFIIIQVDESNYYYFEYDELEDVEGTNETNEDLYITRHDRVIDFDIVNFKADYDEIDNVAEIIETIAYNRCMIKNECITREELDKIIEELRA